MKNKYFTFVALAVAALATSCTTDEFAGQNPIQNQSSSQTVTLTASVDEEQTRVGMTKNGSNANFYWHDKDKILVQTVENEEYSGVEFTTAAVTGSINAEFTGELTGEAKVAGYAVYPYNENQEHRFAGKQSLTYVLPATYASYVPETKIFGTTDNYPVNSTNMPMVGTIVNGKITFKHLGGLAVIRIDKMPDTEGTLTVTADQQLSGNFSVINLSASDAKITSTQASGDNGKVTFTFSGATKDGVGVFYLPLATGTYTNVKVAIDDTEVDYGSVNISRGGVTAISITAYDGELTEYKGKLVRRYSDNKYYLGNYKYSIGNQEFVDLGLSVLWATMNVGAESETGCGKYYDGNEASTVVNDLNGYLSLPSSADFISLIADCGWNLINKDGVNGYEVTSLNGQSIFLPAAGYEKNSQSGGDATAEEKGQNGYYWSNSTPSDGYPIAKFLQFNNDWQDCVTIDNYSGEKYSIRIVTDKP